MLQVSETITISENTIYIFVLVEKVLRLRINAVDVRYN